jgi:hypothetical protein
VQFFNLKCLREVTLNFGRTSARHAIAGLPWLALEIRSLLAAKELQISRFLVQRFQGVVAG